MFSSWGFGTANTGVVKTAHDCSEGGVGVALAEMCIGGRIGADIDLDGTGNCDAFARLWGESLGRIIIAVSKIIKVNFTDYGGAQDYIASEVKQSEKLTINDGFETLGCMQR